MAKVNLLSNMLLCSYLLTIGIRVKELKGYIGTQIYKYK